MSPKLRARWKSLPLKFRLTFALAALSGVILPLFLAVYPDFVHRKSEPQPIVAVNNGTVVVGDNNRIGSSVAVTSSPKPRAERARKKAVAKPSLDNQHGNTTISAPNGIVITGGVVTSPTVINSQDAERLHYDLQDAQARLLQTTEQLRMEQECLASPTSSKCHESAGAKFSRDAHEDVHVTDFATAVVKRGSKAE